tara:strand:- start:121 stop:747 length:627 start_codon:yes stop_codon:yes gene_type:complete
MNRIYIILLIGISQLLSAQNQIAKEILDNLSETTKSYNNITIEFDFTLENESQNINEKQNGKLISKGNGFRLEMDEQTIINNGESQWIYLADMKEVQIMEHDPEDDMMNPSKLFTIYENGYKYTYVGAKSDEGKRMQIIDLFPEESGPFIKITLSINAAKNQLNKIQMLDKNGGSYTYSITKFLTNQNIAPFTFNEADFPEVEVIDLR